ncbi:hypothetical protein PR202_gb11282 [Eleusine coracana subsp. coracana]|uniref:Glycosyltransferase n=1 Tax=Eleusine coracana subsp. coracana TaxID=191504 RepID=A0AAV5EMN0_ELECO|nr:hypothetical protein QOZ80_3BG0265120 [Eleusine coracana subsp. coracana]GJN23618.1 hypothetical protein PR202_gb11282 [Eleusine coracana subsp. coracana]
MDAVSSSSSAPLHVVLCPWLAFGHLLPYLELAERLAFRGHRVSYVTTPGNIARLPPVRPDMAPLIDLVALPLPHVDGLPDGADSTNKVPHGKSELLWKAFDKLGEPFSEFLGAACASGKRPDWLIVDIFHHWAAAAALEHKVPCAVFLLSSASNIASWDRRWSSWRADPAAAADKLAATGHEQPGTVPRYESKKKTQLFANHGPSGMSIVERFFLAVERCTVAAMRSCPEWEPESVALLNTTLMGRPVVPLGLLPPSPDGGRAATTTVDGDDANVRWLDAQPASSVVYVALGSEVPLSVEQVRELAHGLELAGTRFLWALRKPTSAVVDDEDVLPPGFIQRTRGRGRVAMGWVPQLSILAHGAVGAFLTHCGWSSITEALLFGRPLVMLPIAGDQGPNARIMEGKKVGMQVPRDEDDGSFDRQGVATTVRAVMLDEETRRVFVVNAKKLQGIVADSELHESYIDRFIQQLRYYYQK